MDSEVKQRTHDCTCSCPRDAQGALIARESTRGSTYKDSREVKRCTKCNCRVFEKIEFGKATKKEKKNGAR